MGSAAFAVLGLGILLVGFTYHDPTVHYDLIGPSGFPIFIGSAMLIAGCYQSLRTVRYMRISGPIGVNEGTPDEEEYPASALRGIMFIVGSFVYIFALIPIGYLIATPIAVVLALWAMKYRSWPARIIVAVAFTVVGFGLFAVFLQVPLPEGILANVLLDLGIIQFA